MGCCETKQLCAVNYFVTTKVGELGGRVHVDECERLGSIDLFQGQTPNQFRTTCLDRFHSRNKHIMLDLVIIKQASFCDESRQVIMIETPDGYLNPKTGRALPVPVPLSNIQSISNGNTPLSCFVCEQCYKRLS